MNIEINEHDLQIPYVADSLLSRKCHKLERMLNKFDSDSIILNCDIDRTANKKAFQVTLNLKLPQAALKATAVNKSIVNVLSSVFKKLFYSVHELKTTLSATEETMQKRESTELSLQSITMPEESRKSLADFFSRNYGQFHNYTLREIRFRLYQGYIKPGVIDVADVLNEALLMVAEHFTIFYEEKKAQRLCFDYIKKSIDRYLEPHGVTLVPVEAAIEPEDIDIQYQEYYQPDEIIRVEDILVDADSILPEDHAENCPY